MSTPAFPTPEQVVQVSAAVAAILWLLTAWWLTTVRREDWGVRVLQHACMFLLWALGWVIFLNWWFPLAGR